MVSKLYKHKGAFSLKDEIVTCLNIEVEIDVTDGSLFIIRQHHVKEEDKAILDKEMKIVMLLRHHKCFFFSIQAQSF